MTVDRIHRHVIQSEIVSFQKDPDDFPHHADLGEICKHELMLGIPGLFCISSESHRLADRLSMRRMANQHASTC